MCRVRFSLAVGLATAVFALAGCVQEEKLYDVSGTVTYEGKPVPAGLIFFDPEAATGGTQGFANIKDGKFTTAVDGKGVRGGAYTIRVSGFDGKSGNDAPMGRALFDEYRDHKELPKANSELNVEVPKKK